MLTRLVVCSCRWLIPSWLWWDILEYLPEMPLSAVIRIVESTEVKLMEYEVDDHDNDEAE